MVKNKALLQDIGEKTTARQLTTDIENQTTMNTIANWTEKKTAETWKQVSWKRLTNEQRDLAWMVVHECLPTRQFQHRRGMARTQKCPRESCLHEETTTHLMWNCPYAQKLWKKLGKLLNHITSMTNRQHENIPFSTAWIYPPQTKRPHGK